MGQTSIRSVCEEMCQEGLNWDKQVSEVYVKKCVNKDYIGANKYQKCMRRNVSRRIILGKTSIRSVCEEMGSLEKRIISLRKYIFGKAY